MEKKKFIIHLMHHFHLQKPNSLSGGRRILDELTFLGDCRGEQTANPEVALEFLAKHCKWAVVTLAANGCISKHGKEVSKNGNPLLH